MDASDLLPSIASFGDGLAARVVAGCCLLVVASLVVVASFDSCTVFDLISVLFAYGILGQKNRPN